MNIQFATNRLAAASVSLSETSRFFGAQIGKKYIQRLAILRATDKFAQLHGHRALRLHHLKGNRSGQYSITLIGNYRLIVEKVKRDEICIIGVEDYHGN